jgi:prophage regulatory protein
MTAGGLRKMLLEEEVLELIPFSRSTLWRLERTGKFPRSTFISPNRRIWFADEVAQWQETVNEHQPHRRRGKGRRVVAPALLDPENAAST